MQIVDILGNYRYFKARFEPGQGHMSCIWTGYEQLPPSLVVKIQDQAGVVCKALGGGYTHNVMPFPEAICIPECFEAAVCTHPCAGKNNDLLFHDLCLSL